MNIARLIHPGFWFDKTPLEDALKLARLGVGGFCLYGGTRSQVAAFTETVRKVSPLDYLLISADYEDGLGRWLPDAPLLPSNLALGAANDEDLAFEKGFLTARQARSLGVDWVFAPVLDLADNPLNPIVNTRSFGQDPQAVIRLGRAFLNGLHKGGALSSVKHFPGHGDTTTDSHMALPILTKTREQLEKRELVPFQALLPFTDSVMLGHLLLPEIDTTNPASLSPEIADKMLRQQFHYNGCVLTDALLMKAIGDEKHAALRALAVGADILLVPQDPFLLLDFLNKENIAPERVARACARQDALGTKAKNAGPCPSQQTAFAPNDFSYRTARKAITLCGTLPTRCAGQTVHYIHLGADGKTSLEPFLNALKKRGIQAQPFNGQADYLLVVCTRRYQAFSGKITLEENDAARLASALRQASQAAAVSFASPWALPKDPRLQGLLLTFSPAPEFQETAAEILAGQRRAEGTLPVTL